MSEFQHACHNCRWCRVADEDVWCGAEFGDKMHLPEVCGIDGSQQVDAMECQEYFYWDRHGDDEPHPADCACRLSDRVYPDHDPSKTYQLRCVSKQWTPFYGIKSSGHIPPSSHVEGPFQAAHVNSRLNYLIGSKHYTTVIVEMADEAKEKNA